MIRTHDVMVCTCGRKLVAMGHVLLTTPQDPARLMQHARALHDLAEHLEMGARDIADTTEGEITPIKETVS